MRHFAAEGAVVVERKKVSMNDKEKGLCSTANAVMQRWCYY